MFALCCILEHFMHHPTCSGFLCNFVSTLEQREVRNKSKQWRLRIERDEYRTRYKAPYRCHVCGHSLVWIDNFSVDFTGAGICTVRAADKEQRGVSEVLPSKARRVDSGGGVLGEAASPLPISKGVGQRCELSQRGRGMLTQRFFCTLRSPVSLFCYVLRVNSCRSLSICQ